MKERIHHYAPEAAFPRIVFALVAWSVGLPSTVLGLNSVRKWLETGFGLFPGAVLLVPGLILLVYTYYLASGVAEQANAAPPAANPARIHEEDYVNIHPVQLLKKQYSHDDIDKEAFDEWTDRLLEEESIVEETDERESRDNH